MKFNIPEEYRNASGVYIIRNTVNGKVYVGSASILYKRFWVHNNHLSKQKHHSVMLQRFSNKYGIDKLSFDLLEITPLDKELLLSCEQKWMDHYQSFARSKGFNTYPTAGSPLGITRSSETRAKMSAAKKGQKPPPMSAEHRAKLIALNKERRHTPESKDNLSKQAHLRDPELNAKRAATRKKTIAANGNPSVGRKHSEETKAKLSAIFRGRKLSEEQIEKMRMRKASEETRAKLSKAATGKKLSDERKDKLLNGLKARWASLSPEERSPSVEALEKRKKTRKERQEAGVYKKTQHTPEGLARIAETQRKYWEKVRAGEIPPPKRNRGKGRPSA